MLVNFLKCGFLFAFVEFKFFFALFELGEFDFFLVLFLHEEMERLGLFEFFEEMFEFLILLNPLVLLHTHDLQTFHYLLVVLEFFLLCDFHLNIPFHMLFL